MVFRFICGQSLFTGDQFTIGQHWLGKRISPNRQKAMMTTNVGQDYCWTYATFGLSGFISHWPNLFCAITVHLSSVIMQFQMKSILLQVSFNYFWLLMQAVVYQIHFPMTAISIWDIRLITSSKYRPVLNIYWQSCTNRHCILRYHPASTSPPITKTLTGWSYGLYDNHLTLNKLILCCLI